MQSGESGEIKKILFSELEAFRFNAKDVAQYPGGNVVIATRPGQDPKDVIRRASHLDRATRHQHVISVSHDGVMVPIRPLETVEQSIAKAVEEFEKVKPLKVVGAQPAQNGRF